MMPPPDDSAAALLKNVHAPQHARTDKHRPASREKCDAIYRMRLQGASFDLIRYKLKCGMKAIRRALDERGGDPLRGERGTAKPKSPTPRETQEPRPTGTPFGAGGSGRTWTDPIQWHIRCRHGRVAQFCVDCKRTRA